MMMTEKEVKWQKAWMLVCLINKYAEPECAGNCVHIITDDSTFGETSAPYCADFGTEEYENLLNETGFYELQ